MNRNMVLDEIAYIAEENKQNGKALSMPSYFFRTRYGRDIADDFESMKAAGGYNGGFVFRTGASTGDSLVHQFQVKAESQTQLGRKLQGLVLVEIRGEHSEEELKALFLYLKEQEPDIHCVFAAEESKRADGLQRLLERFFFVRPIVSDAYDVSEQTELFVESFKIYGIMVDDEAKTLLAEAIEKHKWKETDCVANKIKNMVYNCVYDGFQTRDKKDTINREEMEKLTEDFRNANEEKRVIGFQYGGV